MQPGGPAENHTSADPGFVEGEGMLGITSNQVSIDLYCSDLY